MKLLSRATLKSLTEVEADSCVSIYLPTHMVGSEIHQDPIRLKNLLGEASHHLSLHGTSDEESEKLLRPAAALIDDEEFWRYQSQGLALFLTAEELQLFRLPISFRSQVVVGNQFYLKPVLPMFVGDLYFYVLALSQNQVRFFQATQHRISEVDLPEMPASLAEALRYDDPEKQLQFHSGSGNGGQPIYHGQGVGTTDDKESLRRFCLKLDEALQPYFSEESAPLVVASVEYLQPIFRDASSYAHVLEAGVQGNPDQMQPDELRQAAWEQVEPLVVRSQQQSLERFANLQHTDRAGSDLEQIVAAAYHGQVETLFLLENSQSWGQYDPATSKVTHGNANSPDSIDLLNLAAVQTWLQGGTVYQLPAEKMAAPAAAAAIYRYELPAPIHA